MDDFQLPPELQELEQELASRPRTGPGAGLRQRILTLTSQRMLPQLASMTTMEYVVAMAATVLLFANLSLSLSNQTDYGLHQKPDTMHLEAAAQEVARLLPEARPQEAFLFALPSQWGSFANSSQAASILRSPGRPSFLEDLSPDH
jgi:hypothetical protein